jgi:hypothetical protein
MKKLLFTSLMAATLLCAWSSCFVNSRKVSTTTGTHTGTGGTDGTGGSAGPSSSSAGTTGTGGHTGSGGFGGSLAGAGGFGGGPTIDVQCNPVTNAGCAGGKACSPLVSGGGLSGFACTAGPNTLADCASCDPSGQTPPFCDPGSICLPANPLGTIAQCAHYCCTDADCGPNGKCATTNSSDEPFFAPVSTTLGICNTTIAVGDAGVGDGGDAGAPSPFACKAPAVSPSQGSCIMLTQ